MQWDREVLQSSTAKIGLVGTPLRHEYRISKSLAAIFMLDV